VSLNKLYSEELERPQKSEIVKEMTLSSDVKVHLHGTKVFAKLRLLEGIYHENILESLSPEVNRQMVFRAGESSGRSGSFFVFTHDRRFMIKSLSKSEFKTLIKILPSYSKHI